MISCTDFENNFDRLILLEKKLIFAFESFFSVILTKKVVHQFRYSDRRFKHALTYSSESFFHLMSLKLYFVNT